MIAYTQPSPRPLLLIANTSSRPYAVKKSAPATASLAGLAVETLRQTLSTFSRSLTALGNSSNAFFAQVSAALALDRAAMSLRHAFGTGPQNAAPFTALAPFVTPFSAFLTWQNAAWPQFQALAVQNSMAFVEAFFGAFAKTVPAAAAR
jgi:hypothetical protein